MKRSLIALSTVTALALGGCVTSAVSSLAPSAGPSAAENPVDQWLVANAAEISQMRYCLRNSN